MTHPFALFNSDLSNSADWIVTCDHASNSVPKEVNGGCLGIEPTDMERHIAYDVGAQGVSIALSRLLKGPCICSQFSRLVIDPNRGEDDPTLIMRLYDGTIIPANRMITPQERERRLSAYHRPYHDELSRLCSIHPQATLVAIHSFTPQLRKRDPRPWHIGVLYAGDNPLARALMESLSQENDLCIGDNEPYHGHLEGDAMDQHGVQQNRAHVLIEIRNDLITTPEQQEAWAKRLAPHLIAAQNMTQGDP